MEIPVKLRGDEVEGEEEEYDSVFYEDIEAPKFVDLAAPDAACPTDDPSWFCLRIGCDQNHEQVDPEALHRSFFMRVMAARSPNVRLQKAINRRNQSSMLPKCPHSAPAKPPRARITRLSRASCAAERGARAKLKNHRICGLRDSPTRTKAARVEASSAKKKALTTPRSNAVRPRHEPFLSVKHQKAPVSTAGAASKGTVVKALFMSTPKKDAVQTPAKTKAPLSEVCSKMRKLNLACREVPSRYLSQLTTPKVAKKCEETAAKSVKRLQDSRTNGKKKVLGCSDKCANAETDEENRNGREKNIAADQNSCTEAARCNEVHKGVLQESRIEVETLQPDDDNKENLSCGDEQTEQTLNDSHLVGENMKQLENNENVHPKVSRMQNKVNTAEQGGKLKKTTIQRPFRLRTDERQVLKEANPERKQTVAENNSMGVLKDGNRRVMQIGRCLDGKGRDRPSYGEKVLKEANPERKQTVAENNSMGVLKDGNHQVMQIGRCLDGKGRDRPTYGEKQKNQNTRAATGLLREDKTVLNSIRCNNGRPVTLAKAKAVEKSQRVTKTAPSTRTDNIASDFMAPSQIGKERKRTVRIPRVQSAAA